MIKICTDQVNSETSNKILKSLIALYDFKQSDIAEKLSISRNTYLQLFERKAITIDDLKPTCDILGVKIYLGIIPLDESQTTHTQVNRRLIDSTQDLKDLVTELIVNTGSVKKELANRLGMSPTTFNALMNKKKFSFEDAQRILELFESKLVIEFIGE